MDFEFQIGFSKTTAVNAEIIVAENTDGVQRAFVIPALKSPTPLLISCLHLAGF